MQYKHDVQCRTPRGAIVSMGLRGSPGGLRGEIEIFPGPPAKKVIKMLICYLFVSTPQSIAKPSPGWNKVALLTAVRNSPCSCPFSVSLHPPQAALNSEPRCIAHWARSARIPRTRWRLLVRFTNLYINNNGDASRPLIFTISYAHPPQGGSHIVQAIFHCALAQFHPFARTDFTAGVSPLTSPFLPGQRSGSRRPPRCRW